MSEEEADEDACGQVDKENQQPYDPHVDGIRAKSELGLSGDVVMKLASTLPEGQNYKIYADNYFTCVPLVVKLLDRGIHYVGTARQVSLPNCNLEDD
ncbi:hypothetical protein JOQ06_014723 [Pogonophryne albipinna]|uniref:PiggyBac transposable element-derived protein domain-containing protein n=1 Tax=Pogonophryne albipinna TaxID=1090488 RepID=A0AAD6FAQ0_9TELE|nr:hypothetical protein JOQ06_014723 [Pogonophryne albipinna]